MFEVSKKPEAPVLVEPKIEPKIEPKVETKPIQKEPILTQAVKREIAPIEPMDMSPAAIQAAPQPASVMVKPSAYAVPNVEAQARPFPVSASDTVSPHAAHASTRMVTGYSGKAEAVAGQFQPKTVSEISNNAIVATSRLAATPSLAPDLFAAKPLSPALIEETRVEDLQGIENGFAGLIRERIAAAKTYPTAARQAGHEGKVLVAFVLDKDGRILDLSVQRSSGHERLDEAAVEAVKKAAPLPPIPEKLRRDSMSFKLPISFNLR